MNKTALITGASSGIGEAFAYRFAMDGHNLVLVARRGERLRSIASVIRSKYSVVVHVFESDLSDMSQIDLLAEVMRNQDIRVDFLINNAGYGAHGAFSHSDYNFQEGMIDLNVKALTKLTRVFLGPMIGRGSGRILNVASIAAFQPGPMMAVYFASKAYVLSFSDAVGEELRGTGVTVSTLCPGPTASEFMEVSGMGAARMIKKWKLPTAQSVVNIAYDGMLKGKRLIIPGWINRLLVMSSRIFPTRMILLVTRYLQQPA